MGEGHGAHHRMPEHLLAVAHPPDLVPVPQTAEVGALHDQLADDRGQVGGVGIGAGHGVQVRDAAPGLLLPVRPQGPGRRVQERVADRVALPGAAIRPGRAAAGSRPGSRPAGRWSGSARRPGWGAAPRAAAGRWGGPAGTAAGAGPAPAARPGPRGPAGTRVPPRPGAARGPGRRPRPGWAGSPCRVPGGCSSRWTPRPGWPAPRAAARACDASRGRPGRPTSAGRTPARLVRRNRPSSVCSVVMCSSLPRPRRSTRHCGGPCHTPERRTPEDPGLPRAVPARQAGSVRGHSAPVVERIR